MTGAAKSLAEAWEQRQGEAPLAVKVPAHVLERRAFYAGALAGAAIPPQQVIRECLDFARTIGRPAELAS